LCRIGKQICGYAAEAQLEARRTAAAPEQQRVE
jgi:hypothetical protein